MIVPFRIEALEGNTPGDEIQRPPNDGPGVKITNNQFGCDFLVRLVDVAFVDVMQLSDGEKLILVVALGRLSRFCKRVRWRASRASLSTAHRAAKK